MLHRAIVSGSDCRVRDAASQLVGGIHSWRAAERVARKLIQQHTQCECTRGRRKPTRQFAAGGLLVQRQKPILEAPVELAVFGEPECRSGLLPKGNDRVGLSQWIGAR
jgi:hypothetical protein